MALTVIKPSGIDTSGNYTVTGMNVSANISVANLSVTTSANLGAVGNIIITGGATGQVLSTNGSGGLSFISVSSSGISNGNSNVNIATANGNVTITAVGNTTLTVTGTGANVSGTLSVSGNATVGNIIASGGGGGNITGANLVSANFFTGTLTTGAQPNITSTGTLTSLSVSGNIIGANLVSANFFTGTLTTAAQPNITSTGTLTSLSVSGNANVGNIGTTNLVATGTGSFGANVNMNTYWINNVGYPSLTTDVATKSYVDTMISTGIAYHQPVAVATTTTLATATGGTTAYNSPNGAANGVGAYISTTGTYLNIDSANVQTVGTRILVKDEANATWNGVYTYANTTAIIRSTDTDEYGPDSTTQLSVNDYFFTQGGTVNKGVSFIVSAPAGTITFGTSNITFSEFSTSQVYSAGTGIAITGTVISANASQTQITAVGTLTSLSVSGTSNLGAVGNVTITGGTNGYVLSTNGSGTLSWVAQSSGGGASISNGTSTVNIATSGGNVTTSVNGNANILVVTGTGANVNGTLKVTGQSNLGAVGNVVITGGTANYALTTDGAGNLSWAAVPGGANVTVDNFTGNGVQTIFTLSTTPIGINQTSVNYNGATVLRTGYTLANANITFSSAPANGSLIEVTTINLTASGGVSAQDLLSPFLLMGA